MSLSAYQIKQYKITKKALAMLTAYDYPMAKIMDESGLDIILVGDSLGDVALGYRNTLPVTMEEMIIHTRAVSRAVKRAMVVADMPFGSFQESDQKAVGNAVKLIKAGAGAVKIEGANYLPAIRKIIKAGIPVMGHLGLLPQSVNQTGYRTQGQNRRAAAEMLRQAKALERAGCFALVIELTPEALAGKISRALKIPTIGIGAGKKTDGQVLVTSDLLGLYDNPPGFARPVVNLKAIIKKGIALFIKGSGPL